MKRSIIIVKVGGKIVEDTNSLKQFIENFSAIPGNKILVHGGGRSATTIAAKLGVENKMIDGRRVTDLEMLKVVTMVYGGAVNKEIVAGLQAKGLNAIGLTGADLDLIRSVKRPKNGIDWGYVGDVVAVNNAFITLLIEQGIIPVLAPLTHDGAGQLLNTNADTIAGEVAKSLAKLFKVTLIYCFEKPGVLLREDDESTVIPYISYYDFPQMVENGIITGGMIPKIQNAFNALNAGVKTVLITSVSSFDKLSGTTIAL
ncbi:MAG TPA: acetylglutamate kinase [Bacteroidaceae bacterium]|nr:acetylglutamate kinase [Bacteroidaceae bacterium]